MSTATLPAQLIRTRRFTLGAPTQFTITADSSTVLFLRSRAGDDPVSCLWATDASTGAERLLADPTALAGSGSIADYAVADTGLIAFALAGQVWTVHASDGRPRQLPTAGMAADPRPDPLGQRIGYASEGALRVIDADGNHDHLVAEPDAADVTFGIAQQAGAVALPGGRGFWWSPDGTKILLARVDSARVQLRYIADPAEPTAVPLPVRYPAAGTANAEVTLWIADLDGTRTQVRLSHAEYLPDAGWDSHGPYAVAQSRDQRVVRFLQIDPVTGESAVVATKRDECWVQLVPGLPVRTAAGHLIWHADVGDTRHLKVGDDLVTPPGLQLRAVLGTEGDEVLFTASADPLHSQLWSYRPGSPPRQLSSGPWVHAGARRGGTLVKIGGRQATVVRDGTVVADISSCAERPELDLNAHQLVLGARELRATLYLPSWYAPGGGKLPVLADPYGGPSHQRVTAELAWHRVLSQWFAEQGFAVLVTDGRGTSGRGPRWERAVYGDIFGPVICDQVDALAEAGRLHPELDLDRVGIRGWSFGGALAAMAVLRRPDIFHAAVAGAPVSDRRMYNTLWQERFLGHPDEFGARYDAASLILAAPSLTRPLLLIHGLADENVFPAHTIKLSSTLLAAGRSHDMLLLPGVGHPQLGPGTSENVLWAQVRFLRRHLAMTSGPPSGLHQKRQ